jgi:hypothetical protein
MKHNLKQTLAISLIASTILVSGCNNILSMIPKPNENSAAALDAKKPSGNVTITDRAKQLTDMRFFALELSANSKKSTVVLDKIKTLKTYYAEKLSAAKGNFDFSVEAPIIKDLDTDIAALEKQLKETKVVIPTPATPATEAQIAMATLTVQGQLMQALYKSKASNKPEITSKIETLIKDYSVQYANASIANSYIDVLLTELREKNTALLSEIDPSLTEGKKQVLDNLAAQMTRALVANKFDQVIDKILALENKYGPKFDELKTDRQNYFKNFTALITELRTEADKINE